ncbi:Uncharacterized protein SCO2049 [Durusdinium trenchii]|uniref:Uncharacterized protein SCO2049 n=1 Tax=Durusdinium trenchii TaxID=1381693 RepID=A0ABP0S2D8_9DINO
MSAELENGVRTDPKKERVSKEEWTARFFVVLGFCAGVLGVFQAFSAAADVARLQDELNAAEAQIASTTRSANELEELVNRLQEQVALLNTTELQERVTVLENDTSALEVRFVALEETGNEFEDVIANSGDVPARLGSLEFFTEISDVHRNVHTHFPRSPTANAKGILSFGYGSSFTTGNDDFTLFGNWIDGPKTSTDGIYLDNGVIGEPGFGRGRGCCSTFTYDSFGPMPAGTIFAQPGPVGFELAKIRLTVPFTGVVLLDGSFQSFSAIPSYLGRVTKVPVGGGSAETLFSIATSSAAPQPFKFSTQVQEGDLIFISVGPEGDFVGDIVAAGQRPKSVRPPPAPGELMEQKIHMGPSCSPTSHRFELCDGVDVWLQKRSGKGEHRMGQAQAAQSSRDGAEAVKRVTSGAAWEEAFGYSRAVRAGRTVHVSGTTAPGSTAVIQANEIFDKIELALSGLGASVGDIVRTRIYVTDIKADADALGKVHQNRVGKFAHPACTMVQVGSLVDDELKVEIEVEAYISAKGDSSAA